MNTTQLLVRKDHLPTTRLRTTEDAPLADAQVRVRIDSFALTSNNITYAAFGDLMNYWQFYPTGEDGFGIIPVWGFGSVVQSQHPGVAVGERLYGYWPMASSVVLTPTRLSPGNFIEGAAHRAALHPIYNQVARCSADPFYTADTEDVQSLLRPLFTTSWLIDDFLADNDFFGAKTLLLSSASSKTAYGTASRLILRPGIEVIGLTSAGNKAFCESLGCYSRVLTYEQLGQLAADTALAYVDFAGNATLREAIHTRFTNLKYDCAIGGTHVKQLGGAKNLAGPPATLFFAPAQIKKREGEWGPEEFRNRLVRAWQTFVDQVTRPAQPWVKVQRHVGAKPVQDAYAQVLGGQGDARVGHILSIADA